MKMQKSKNREAKDCLNALLELEEGLTDWEVNFIDSIILQSYPMTEKQETAIFKIYDKKC